MSRNVTIQSHDSPDTAVGVILDALTKEGFSNRIVEQTENRLVIQLGRPPEDLQPTELLADPDREGEDFENRTGIFVRAKLNGKWGSFDIVQLQKESLLAWLRSRPNFAEQVALILLGHRV